MNKNNKIGVLWTRVSKQGTPFLSGKLVIEGKQVSVIIFTNRHKKEDKHPDYEVWLSERQEYVAPTAQTGEAPF